MKLAYVDAVGGASGDMLLSALIDAGAAPNIVQAAVDAVLPGRFRIGVERTPRSLLRLARLHVTATGSPSRAPRPFGSLLEQIERAALDPTVRAMAVRILQRLGAAEARVHGRDLNDLVLHQLGEDDTLLDVVGAAAAVQALEIEQLLVGPLPVAFGGRIAGGHGALPLPAPATLELLHGFAIKGVVGEDELVTPTAAAILSAVGTPALQFSPMTVERIGYGAGSRDDPSGMNFLRILLGTRAGVPRERQLSLLETNLDDLSPQLVADAAESLRAAGALDVWVTPVQMKKGRAGIVLAALCDLEHEAALRRVIFHTTSTLGVRAQTVRRSELDRRVVEVSLEGGRVRVKLGLLDGKVLTATPEHDDVVARASESGRAVRAVHEEAVALAHELSRAEPVRAAGR